MGIVLKCYTCNRSDEPHKMYRGNREAVWYCEECYQERRKKLKGKMGKPIKVMSYKEQQRIHRNKWKRFRRVMKDGGNTNTTRDKENLGHKQVGN